MTQAASPGFSHPFVVRFSQVDGAGIVFFSRIFELCHEAFEAALDAGALPLRDILADRAWGLPLVHSEASFRRPLRLGDQGSVAMQIAEQDGKRVTFAYTVRTAQGVHATARFTHAAVDLADFRPRPLPDELAQALAAAGIGAW